MVLQKIIGNPVHEYLLLLQLVSVVTGHFCMVIG